MILKKARVQQAKEAAELEKLKKLQIKQNKISFRGEFTLSEKVADKGENSAAIVNENKKKGNK